MTEKHREDLKSLANRSRTESSVPIFDDTQILAVLTLELERIANALEEMSERQEEHA